MGTKYNRFGEAIGTTNGSDKTDYSQKATDTGVGGSDVSWSAYGSNYKATNGNSAAPSSSKYAGPADLKESYKSTSPVAYNNYVYNGVDTNTSKLMSQYAPTNSGSDLLPLRDTFEGRGYGVKYDNGNIYVYDPKTTNLLGTFDKNAYTTKDGKAYFDPNITKNLLSLTAPKLDNTDVIAPVAPVEPVPTLNPLQPFQYQPFQMSPNLPTMSSSGDTWTPTLAAKNQWYGQQDQLRNSYLDDWYRKQALAQDQAKTDWEKEKYNDPTEKALRDIQLEYIKSQIKENNAQAIKAASGGSGKGVTKTKTPSASEQRYAWEEGVASTSEYYKSGDDYLADLQRNKTAIIQKTGSAGYRRLEEDAQNMIKEGRTGSRFSPGGGSPLGTALGR